IALAAGDEVVMIPAAAGEAESPALPPRRGLHAGREIVAWLEELPISSAVDWAALARRLRLAPRYPGALLAISDFWTDGAIEALLPLTKGRQEVALLRVLSAEELSPSCRGNVRLVDAESGEEISLRLSPRDIDVYRATVQNHLRHLAERASRNGMRHLLCRPEQPLAQAILVALRGSRLLR
ncbi:MAG: hypothetical protein N3A66_11610, partial [Planctomycetota bacterium]|nr:hypothetical protein [Planctomycetota bacterium]